MADDEAQGPDETPWGASDAFSDPLLPTMGFDEPLVWPEAAVWDDIAGVPASDLTGLHGGLSFPLMPDMARTATAIADTPTHVSAEPLPDPGPPVDSDAQWRPIEDPGDPDPEVQQAGPLAALGGGSGQTAPQADGSEPSPTGALGAPWPPEPVGRVEPSVAEPPAEPPALGSIWSNDLRAEPHDLVGFGGLPAPTTVYAETERNARSPRWRRFDVRPGNAAVIGLISVVSLVLLGMFLSVRARNDDVPTDASQQKPAGNEISATAPLNTVPSTTITVTTTIPEPVINLSELLPATEAGAGSAATGGAAASATTTPTTRSAAPAGGGSATTTPVTQAPATTAPPPPTTAATSPPPTAPPPTEDDINTVRRPTTPSFTIPSITLPSSPTITMPRNRWFPDDD